jgi:hypothetical protein
MEKKLGGILNAVSDERFQLPHRFPSFVVAKENHPIGCNILASTYRVVSPIEGFVYSDCVRPKVNVIHSESIQFRATKSRSSCQNKGHRVATLPALIQTV